MRRGPPRLDRLLPRGQQVRPRPVRQRQRPYAADRPQATSRELEQREMPVPEKLQELVGSRTRTLEPARPVLEQDFDAGIAFQNALHAGRDVQLVSLDVDLDEA